jgi:hypothetical protein
MGSTVYYEAIGSAVGAFSSAAASGQVSIEAEAASDALTEIGNIKAQLDSLVRTSAAGQTDVQIGNNPVGTAMAAKSMDRFDGADSFVAVLRLLLEQTEKAENALNQCIRNYVDEDDLRALNLGGTQA